jgi:hypothetical protein
MGADAPAPEGGSYKKASTEISNLRHYEFLRRVSDKWLVEPLAHSLYATHARH